MPSQLGIDPETASRLDKIELAIENLEGEKDNRKLPHFKFTQIWSFISYESYCASSSRSGEALHAQFDW